MGLRIGHGFDVHRLVAGRELHLGGVRVPFSRGLLGHSDGDAVLHALCDALLGAMGAGDMGQRFPDTEPQFEGMDSAVFVRDVVQLLRAGRYAICSVDVTIVADVPRLAPHVDVMRRRLAELLEVAAGRVGLKAKTVEGLGAIGSGDAIAASAVVLIEKREEGAGGAAS